MAELFKPDWEESLSLFISLSCISVMALLFGRKTAGTKWGTINYARGLVIALYLVSWGFSLMATLLVQTNNKNPLSCNLSIFACITLYASSKIIIYLFLMEKVYVVTAVGSTRRDFFLYKVNMCLLLPYVAVITLMIIFRHARINQLGQADPVPEHRLGHCDIGLGEAATYPLIFYDIFVSCWLTFLFIRPLMSSTSMLQGPSKGKLRDVARRTLMGCVMSLIISTGNVASLITSQGWERGLICLSCCTADVTMNAITIHWVTSRGGGRVSGTGRSTRDRNGTGHRGTNGVNSGYYLTAAEKQVGPLDSHLSITVESYVEEYHQMSLARSAENTSSLSGFAAGDTASRYITDPLPPTRYGEGVRASRFIEPVTPTRFEVRSSRYGDPGSSRYVPTSDEPMTPTRFEVRSSRYGDLGSSRYVPTTDEISSL